jgi:hypothetical protein
LNIGETESEAGIEPKGGQLDWLLESALLAGTRRVVKRWLAAFKFPVEKGFQKSGRSELPTAPTTCERV